MNIINRLWAASLSTKRMLVSFHIVSHSNFTFRPTFLYLFFKMRRNPSKKDTRKISFWSSSWIWERKALSADSQRFFKLESSSLFIIVGLATNLFEMNVISVNCDPKDSSLEIYFFYAHQVILHEKRLRILFWTTNGSGKNIQ